MYSPRSPSFSVSQESRPASRGKLSSGAVKDIPTWPRQSPGRPSCAVVVCYVWFDRLAMTTVACNHPCPQSPQARRQRLRWCWGHWGGQAWHQPPKWPSGTIQTLAEPRSRGSGGCLSLHATNCRRTSSTVTSSSFPWLFSRQSWPAEPTFPAHPVAFSAHVPSPSGRSGCSPRRTAA